MELVETGYALRRDRKLRWMAVGTLLLLTQVVAVIVSITEHAFDPWLFAIVAAPALGVAAGVLSRRFLAGPIALVRLSQRDAIRVVTPSGGRRSP